MPDRAPEPNLPRSAPRQAPGIAAGTRSRTAPRARLSRVLLCGRARSLAGGVLGLGGCAVVLASSAEEARGLLAETAPDRAIDLAVLDAALPGARGASLAEACPAGRSRAGLVLLGDPAAPLTARDAARTGLLDVLEPGAAALPRVAAALRRVEASASREAAREADRRRERRRSRRLARRCSRLEARCAEVEARRQEISEQVESLCGDLVAAYQELADRLDAAESGESGESGGAGGCGGSGQAGGAAAAARPLDERLADELGLEPVIRSTLEHLVEAAGPTNAAVFLPASHDEFSLGGYVSHTCTSESASMLLEHLADVAAPKLSEAAGPVHLTDNAQLAAWFEADAAWLDDSELLGVPCLLESGDDAECLAVVVLFRDRDQPYQAGALEACERLGPVLAACLHRLIRVHHRAGYAAADDGEPA